MKTAAPLSLALLVVLSGCTTYKHTAGKLDVNYQTGAYGALAAETIELLDKSEDKRNHLLALLESGSAMRLMSLYHCDEGRLSAYQKYPPQNPAVYSKFVAYGVEHGAELEIDPYKVKAGFASEDFLEVSSRIFEDAHVLFQHWDAQPSVSASEEISRALSSQNQVPYRGTNYDRVMAYTYLALNSMQLGSFEDALINLNRMHAQQSAAVADNAKRIEKAQEMARLAKEEGTESEDGETTQTYDVDKAKEDPVFASAYESNYGYLEQFEPYGDFANPFALWLDGIYRVHLGTSRGEIENGLKSLQQVYGMIDAKEAMLPMIEFAENISATGSKPEPTTYVIVESGRAPVLDQTKIDIPIFILGGPVSHVGAAFPRFVRQDGMVDYFEVSAGDATKVPFKVCDMDRVITEEFERALPTIITKILISAGTKATLSAILNKQMADQNPWLGYASMIGTYAYGAGTNNADLRSWHLLPKAFFVTALPTPDDGRIRILPGGAVGFAEDINVPVGTSNVIYVRSIAHNNPILVTQFPLQPNPGNNIAPIASSEP